MREKSFSSFAGRDISRSPKEKYKGYLRSPAWQAKRRERLALDGYRCQECGTSEQLDVHHLIYRPWGTEGMTDLLTLCRDHHYSRHEEQRMSNVITLTGSDDGEMRAFDALRREDENGEFWSGRELQGPYGYCSWQKFMAVIKRAMVGFSLSITDNPTLTRHFTRLDKSGGQGRSMLDYRLSRHAAYLVALAGDEHKPEIARAKSYFAVRTRQAEVLLDGLATAAPVLQAMQTSNPALQAMQNLYAITGQLMAQVGEADLKAQTAMDLASTALQEVRQAKIIQFPETPKLGRKPIYAAKRCNYAGPVPFYRELRKRGFLLWPDGNYRNGNLFPDEIVARGWGRNTVEKVGPDGHDFYVPEFFDDGIKALQRVLAAA